MAKDGCGTVQACALASIVSYLVVPANPFQQNNGDGEPQPDDVEQLSPLDSSLNGSLHKESEATSEPEPDGENVYEGKKGLQSNHADGGSIGKEKHKNAIQSTHTLKTGNTALTQTFGSPGPPSLDILEVLDDTSLESTGHQQIGDQELSIYDNNYDTEIPVREASMSTLSQDDMTIDAQMGRPPRITNAGRLLQIQQAQRERVNSKSTESTKGDSDEKPHTNGVETTRKQMVEHEDIMKLISELAHSLKPPVPTVKLFDAAVVYDKSDYEDVKQFMDVLRTVAFETFAEDLRIELFDSEEFAQSMVTVVGDVVERCSAVFLYLTDNCNTEVFRLFCDEAVGLSRLGLNNPGSSSGMAFNDRKWILKPVHTQPPKGRHYQTPLGLVTLAGIDWYDWPSRFVRDKITSVLKTALNRRKSREIEQNTTMSYEHTFGDKLDKFQSDRPSHMLPSNSKSTHSMRSMFGRSVDATLSLGHPRAQRTQDGRNTAPSMFQTHSLQQNRHLQQFPPAHTHQLHLGTDQPQEYLQQLDNPTGKQSYRDNTPYHLYYQEHLNHPQYGHEPQRYTRCANPYNGSVHEMLPGPAVPPYRQDAHSNNPSLMQDQLSYQFPNYNSNIETAHQRRHGIPPQCGTSPPNQYIPQQKFTQTGYMHAGSYQNGQPIHNYQSSNHQQSDAYTVQNQNHDRQLYPNQPIPNSHLDQTNMASQSGAEYGSLMRDKRHDTPLSTELQVVSRLTGKLITNPDLSNTDLEVDMDGQTDVTQLGDKPTGSYITGNKSTTVTLSGNTPLMFLGNPPKEDATGSSDDSDESSDDGEDTIGLSALMSNKGKVINIVGSSVVQLGKHNKTVEKYRTKHIHTRKGQRQKETIELNQKASREKLALLDSPWVQTRETWNDFSTRMDTGTTINEKLRTQYPVGDSMDMRPSYMDNVIEIIQPKTQKKQGLFSCLLNSVHHFDSSVNVDVLNTAQVLTPAQKSLYRHADTKVEHLSDVDTHLSREVFTTHGRINKETPNVINNLNHVACSNQRNQTGKELDRTTDSLVASTNNDLEGNRFVTKLDQKKDVADVLETVRDDDLFGDGEVRPQPNASFVFGSFNPFRTYLVSKSDTAGVIGQNCGALHHKDDDLD